MGCIYKATNKVNGKSYIGQTNFTLEKRRREHERMASRRPNTYFLKALNKYGFDSFEWRILEDGIYDQHGLNEAEKKHIGIHKTVKPGGYNLTYGGEGGIPCKNTIEKMRKSALENANTLFWRANFESGYYKAVNTEQFRERTRQKALKQKIPIICIETGIKYDSWLDALGQTGINSNKACNDSRITAGGYHWRKIEDIGNKSIEELRRELCKPLAKIISQARLDLTNGRLRTSSNRSRRCLVNGVKRKPRDRILTIQRIADIKREEKARAKSERLLIRKQPVGQWENEPKRIRCIETGQIFSSTKEAGRLISVDHRRIRKVCQGKAITVYGLHYEYA